MGCNWEEGTTTGLIYCWVLIGMTWKLIFDRDFCKTCGFYTKLGIIWYTIFWGIGWATCMGWDTCIGWDMCIGWTWIGWGATVWTWIWGWGCWKVCDWILYVTGVGCWYWTWGAKYWVGLWFITMFETGRCSASVWVYLFLKGAFFSFLELYLVYGASISLWYSEGMYGHSHEHLGWYLREQSQFLHILASNRRLSQQE